MQPILLALTIVSGALLFSSSLAVFYYWQWRRLRQRTAFNENSGALVSELVKQGARFYYDEQTEKACRRCFLKSRDSFLYVRKRFKMGSDKEGSTQLSELTKLFYCGTCNSKSLSLRRLTRED